MTGGKYQGLGLHDLRGVRFGLASDRTRTVRSVEWLRFCGQVFKSIFVPRIRILSRRDYRTQPGVLTPGTDKKDTRPEGGGREAFSALDAQRDPQRISAAPSSFVPYSQNYGGQTGRSIRSKYLSTFSKPHQPAKSCHQRKHRAGHFVRQSRLRVP